MYFVGLVWRMERSIDTLDYIELNLIHHQSHNKLMTKPTKLIIAQCEYLY